MQAQDIVSLFIIIGIVGVVLYLYARKRIRFSTYNQENHSYSAHSSKRNSEAISQLEMEGYEIISYTQRIPVKVHTLHNLKESLIRVDCIVKKYSKVYAVKIRPRSQTKHSVTSVWRDLFLLHVLLQTDGVLYVDEERRRITPYTFEWDYPTGL